MASPSAPLPSPSEALAHFSSLCDGFFLHQDPVAEQVILLVSTAEANRLGEITLRQKVISSVAVTVQEPTVPASEPSDHGGGERILSEAERAQVATELQKLGFHPGGKLLIGDTNLLRRFIEVKNKRRKKFQSDLTASNFVILRGEYLAKAAQEGPRTEETITETDLVDRLGTFLAKYPDSLVAGPFLKGLATALALKVASNIAESVVEWVLFDSLFVIADEAYLRDIAELLVQSLRCTQTEVSDEDAKALGLTEKKYDSSEVRRRWKVTISKDTAQAVLREHPSLAKFSGKAAGEFVVNGMKVNDEGKVLQRVTQQQQRAQHSTHNTGVLGMIWGCCPFL